MDAAFFATGLAAAGVATTLPAPRRGVTRVGGTGFFTATAFFVAAFFVAAFFVAAAGVADVFDLADAVPRRGAGAAAAAPASSAVEEGGT